MYSKSLLKYGTVTYGTICDILCRFGCAQVLWRWHEKLTRSGRPPGWIEKETDEHRTRVLPMHFAKADPTSNGECGWRYALSIRKPTNCADYVIQRPQNPNKRDKDWRSDLPVSRYAHYSLLNDGIHSFDVRCWAFNVRSSITCLLRLGLVL